MKKKLFALIIIIGVIFLIAGCSGGSSDSSSQGTDTASQGQSSTPADGSAASQTPASSSSSSASGTAAGSAGTAATPAKLEIPRKFQYQKGKIPKKIEYLLDNGTPVIIAFFESNDTLSDKIKPQIKDLVSEYNTAQIRYFNLTDSKNQDETRLSIALGVKHLPYIGIIDRDKKIVFENNGFIDINYLDHAIYNVVYRDLGQN